jgi:hypothetical protein
MICPMVDLWQAVFDEAFERLQQLCQLRWPLFLLLFVVLCGWKAALLLLIVVCVCI